MKKRHTLLENVCDKIDKIIAQDIVELFDKNKEKGNFGNHLKDSRHLSLELKQKKKYGS